jgi:nucleoside 2-deoxyribosyltransferase
MKAGEFIETFERFFLDIVGTIFPGFVFLVGCCYLTGKPLFKVSNILFDRLTDYEWVFLTAFSYIIGHAITSLGFNLVKIVKIHVWKLHFDFTEEKSANTFSNDPIYKAFLKTLLSRIPALSTESIQSTNPRTWRNMALSIAPEQNQLIYRFTFMALLNLGVATVCFCILVLWAVLLFLKALHFPVYVIDLNYSIVLFAVLPPLFLERFYSFKRRAFQTPFSMALAKLANNQEAAVTSPKPLDISPITQHRISASRVIVYLAGGFKSGWQTELMKELPEYDYFDPRLHGLVNKSEYTAWDLEAVRRCDLLFAYIESKNPGGYALALEVGYAKALGKFVVLVDEKSASDASVGRYLEMISQTADVTFNKLQDGIAFIKRFRISK